MLSSRSASKFHVASAKIKPWVSNYISYTSFIANQFKCIDVQFKRCGRRISVRGRRYTSSWLHINMSIHKSFIIWCVS